MFSTGNKHGNANPAFFGSNKLILNSCADFFVAKFEYEEEANDPQGSTSWPNMLHRGHEFDQGSRFLP